MIVDDGNPHDLVFDSGIRIVEEHRHVVRIALLKMPREPCVISPTSRLTFIAGPYDEVGFPGWIVLATRLRGPKQIWRDN